MKPSRKRISEISKEAFLAYYDHERTRLDILPMTPEQREKLWERARKRAVKSTESTIFLDLLPREREALLQQGFEVKIRYIV